MILQNGIKPTLSLLSLLIAAPYISAAETEWQQEFSGVLDARLTSTDSLDGYVSGGTGRFRYSDGTTLSLAQASIKYSLTYGKWSIHSIGTGYLDDENDALGITEAFIRYRGTPNMDGFRQQFRAGIIYPKISLENIATAWLSPYTVTFSTQNTWIGEEVRHTGLEWSMDWLGQSRGSKQDINVTATAFQYNDPTGALLAWHGWTMSSRQTLWKEQLPFPITPALLPGNMLENQAWVSDPFSELDSDFGVHLKMDWRWDKKLRLRVGHYDNQAADDVIVNGQYTWRTQFSHLGLEWRLDRQTTIISQFMTGDTRMRVMNDLDVVGLDFTNGFILVSHVNTPHRFSVRYEQFNNEDFDNIPGDNNDDQGDAITLSYHYNLGGGTYLMFEFNQIDSQRPAQTYQSLSVNQKESQLNAGIRYYF